MLHHTIHAETKQGTRDDLTRLRLLAWMNEGLFLNRVAEVYYVTYSRAIDRRRDAMAGEVQQFL